MTRYLALLLVVCCGAADAPSRAEQTERIVGTFDNGYKVFAVDDTANGVTCYMTEAAGYRGMAISCVKVTP